MSANRIVIIVKDKGTFPPTLVRVHGTTEDRKDKVLSRMARDLCHPISTYDIAITPVAQPSPQVP